MNFTFHNDINNTGEIIFELCKVLNVNITKSTIKKELKNNPSPNSLLALSDFLLEHHVESETVEIKNFDLIKSIKHPIVVHLIDKNIKKYYFAIIYTCSDNTLYWYNPQTHKKEYISYDGFKKFFSGIILIPKKNGKSNETEYKEHRKEELIEKISKTILWMFLPLLFLLSTSYILIKKEETILILYALLYLIGAITALFLVKEDGGNFTPTIEKICTFNKKTNCNAVLSSQGATIFGYHWSVIGFSYFCGCLISLFLHISGCFSMLHILILLNLFALPYTIYSILYQYRTVKQWCPLCLLVQVTLLALAIITPFNPFTTEQIFLLPTFISVLNIFIVFVGTNLYLRCMELERTNEYMNTHFQRFKLRKNIFNLLLSEENTIETPIHNLGISFGNPKGNIHLIGIIGTDCNACAEEIPRIFALLKSHPNLIHFQMILFAPLGTNKEHIAKLFLAIYQYQGPNEAEKAITSWFSMSIKERQLLLEQHNFSQERINEQEAKLKQMWEWIVKEKNVYTPKFYLNGKTLPQYYNIADLKWLI